MQEILKNGYTIRAISKDDIENIARLEKECFAVPMSEENISNFLLGENSLSFVCYETNSNDSPCAYGGAICVLDEAQILNVATAPLHRRKGLGNLVMTALIDAAQKKGIRSMTLEVRESNSAARNLYDNLGFYEIGRIKKYYVKPIEDALILKLDI